MTELIAQRFEVIAPLGAGAMGAVYHVSDRLAGGREVALKVIQVAGAITPDVRLRFGEEFRAMTRLAHPNTVSVHDFGQVDEHNRFFTMELVPGQELSALAGPRLPLAEAYTLLVQLLQALGFIHSRLYVHRDIKAANIRVKPDGTLKLIDFGLMAQLGLPSGGKVSGTPGGMPPEVVQGGAIDQRSDLYSVGCLAYELLTGEPPFQGKLIDVIRAHCQVPPPDVRLKRPEVPEALASLLLRLMAKDPGARPAHAGAVIDDLASLAGIAVTRENQAQKHSYLVTGTLVGRERELTTLKAALDGVKAGDGRAIFVAAPAGVGKSRLARELVVQAKLDGLPVFHVVCLDRVVTPYKFLARALKPLLVLATDAERERHGPVLATLFPDAGALAGTAPLDAERERQRAHEALAALLGEISARTPLVFSFDDLQWCDPRSLEALNHCIRALDTRPVLFVGTFRSDEVDPGSPLLHTVAEGFTELLPLAPFAAEQVRELVAAMLPEATIEDAAVRALYDATAGNAFFVTEVLRDLIEQGVLVHREGAWHFPDEAQAFTTPPSVEATVLARLGRLGPQARALAGVAAVLGRYQNRDMLRAVSGMEAEALFERLDELVARQFILKEGHRYTFPHDRVREALYADLAPAVREELHRRAGVYLEGLGEARRSAMVNKLAYHYGRSADHEKAFGYLREAGARACQAGVITVAIRRWQQAAEALARLDRPDRPALEEALWWDLGKVSVTAQPTLAVAVLIKLVARLEAARGEDAGRPPTPGEGALIGAYSLLGAALGVAGEPRRGLDLLVRTLGSLPQAATPDHAARLMTQAPSLVQVGRIDRAMALAAEADEIFTSHAGDGLPAELLLARLCAAGFRGSCAYQGLRPDAALSERAIALAAQAGATHLVVHFRHYEGLWAAWTGRQDEGEAYLDAVGTRSRVPDSHALYIRACLAWQRGEHAEAVAAVAYARRQVPAGEGELAHPLLTVLEGQALLALGDLAGAARAIAGAESEARERGLGIVLMRALLARAEVSLARSDVGHAEEALHEALALARDPDTRNPLHEGLALRGLGEAAAKAGGRTRAMTHFEAALSLFQQPEQDNTIEQARALEALGTAHAGEGASNLAADAWRRAAELYHGLRNRHGLHSVLVRLEGLATAPAQEEALSPEQRWLRLKAMAL